MKSNHPRTTGYGVAQSISVRLIVPIKKTWVFAATLWIRTRIQPPSLNDRRVQNLSLIAKDHGDSVSR